MPFDSRAYRILIASPSDVEEEREIAVRVIQEWNDLYSHARGVVLLPLRWETHTAPEYGTRPQEVINRAIVDECDLLVGIFWTRIGTPTGVADSGTIEEITKVAAAGKPVMLYFSSVGADPVGIDLAQMAKLTEFRAKTTPHALIEPYKSHLEFRDKFVRQLEMKVRDLQKGDERGHAPPLTFTIIGDSAGGAKKLDVMLPVITDFDSVIAGDPPAIQVAVNEAAREAIAHSVEVPIILAIGNTGAAGIRNLFVQVLIHSSSADFTILTASERSNIALWPRLNFFYAGASEMEVDDNSLRKEKDGWHFSFEWDALQPQRTRWAKPRLYVRSFDDLHLDFHAKIFADSFAEPVHLEMKLDILVHPIDMTVNQLLPNLDALRTPEKAAKFTLHKMETGD